MDLGAVRKQHAAVPVEHRDWPVNAAEFRRFAERGRNPIGAAILVWGADHRILLVRERSKAGKQGWWATPGGFAEPGESPEACAVREAREEAGVDVRITGLSKVILCHVVHGERGVDYAFFQFEGQRVAGRLRPGAGIAEVAWFDSLPEDLHFRADYVDVWRRGRPSL